MPDILPVTNPLDSSRSKSVEVTGVRRTQLIRNYDEIIVWLKGVEGLRSYRMALHHSDFDWLRSGLTSEDIN